MRPVKVYHSLPKDLHAVQPKISTQFSVRLAPDEKAKPPKKPEYYNGPPWTLFKDDIILFFQNIFYLKNIVFPLWGENPGRPFPSGPLDELYPSLSNIHDIVFHIILIITQSAFFLSMPFLAALPFPVFLAYVILFVAVNEVVCWRLNGSLPGGVLCSSDFPECKEWEEHPDEEWVFLNGVAVGKHWLQSNIDRLSLTFHRKILGVHNKTSGIIFDVVQCLLERCMYFGTSDTRACFAIISTLLRSDKKVILILHSQGGLEGSIILDWLMNQHPQEVMQKLEIYTFGNAANHFNNPRTSKTDEQAPMGFDDRALGHIEHFANSEDFVSRWGVMHFKKETADPAQLEKSVHNEPKATVYAEETRIVNLFRQHQAIWKGNGVEEGWNSYHGKLFERHGSGHQLNQHYLDNIFPLDINNKRVDVTSSNTPLRGTFMDTEVEVVNDPREMDKIRRRRRGHRDRDENGTNGVGNRKKVYELSRLWKYTNGRCPDDK